MKVKLCDVFDLQMGKTPSRDNLEYWNGKHKWVAIGDMGDTGKYISHTKECISDEGVAKSGIKPVPAGTVIMSFKLSIGKTAITTEEIYTNEAIMAFIDKKVCSIDVNYIYHLFSGMDWSEGSNKAVMGITLNKAALSQKTINIPEIYEQQSVACILDKLDDLISLRKQQLAKLDKLVKARFVEILGEDYPIVTAESVCLNIVDCPHSTPKYEGNELIYPAIRTSEINNGDIDWSSMKYVSYSEYLERAKRLVPLPGDIVYAREGTYGDCVILPKDSQFCLGQRTMLFRPNRNKCTSSYLHQALRSDEVKKQADESNAGSTVPHVNVADAKKFKFPLPPLDLQHEFDFFTSHINKTKLTIQQSLDKLEELKKSLMQEYFG